MVFDGGEWYGWFQSFNVSETAESPFTFNLSMVFQVEREVHGVRTQRGRLQMKGTTATDPYIYLPMGEDVILFPDDDPNALSCGLISQRPP